MDEKKIQEMMTKTVEDVNAKTFADFEKDFDLKLSETSKKNLVAMKKAAKDAEKDAYGISNEAKSVFFNGLKSIFSGEEVSVKIANISADDEGGYGVQDELFAGILRIAGTYGTIAALATRYPMTSKGLEFIRNSQGALLGQFVGELEGTDDTDISFKSVLLEKKTWQIIFGVSRDHLKYSNIDAVNIALVLIAEGMAARIEKEALEGGTFSGSPFVGALAHNDVSSFTLDSGNTDFADMTLEQAGQAVASLEKSVKAGAAWLFHPTVWAKIKYEKDTAGNYVVAQRDAQLITTVNDISIASAGSYEGYPVFTTEFLPALTDTAANTSFGLFGNIERAIGFAVDQNTAEIETSNSATVGNVNAYTQRATFYRANADLSVGIVEPAALVKLTTATV